MLDNLSPESSIENPPRSPESKLDEILETVRDLSRRTSLRSARRGRLFEDLLAGFDAEVAKIEEYVALTEKSIFTIEIFWGPNEHQFIGRLTESPAELPEVAAGQPYQVLKTVEPKIIGGNNKDALIELFKSIVELGGRLTSFTRIL